MSSLGEQQAQGNTIADEWANLASALARWALVRLVNRNTAYGSYTEPSKRNETYEKDGADAKILQSFTKKSKVTPTVLMAHFRGRKHSDVIGLHTTNNLDNTSKWGNID